MVTAFYIMQMKKNKNDFRHFSDYYNHLFITGNRNFERKCRVCLQEGKVPWDNGDADLVNVLQKCADINIREDDGLPGMLCDVCHQFVKVAIIFKNTAKKSDTVLRAHLKEATDVPNPHYSSDDNTPSSALKEENDHADHNSLSDDMITSAAERKNDHDSSSNTIKAENKLKCLSKKITCTICRKVISRSYYSEHLKMHDPNPEKYCCEVCGKVFKLRCSYYNHKLRHRADFTFKCHLCPYRGRYLELLKNHLRTHSGDFRYMCTECPARFLYKSNLNSHMRRHKEPEFKCDSCKRGFHTKVSLERHIEADHLGIKNHVCPLCGKAFGYRNGMMKHQRHVHKREKMLFGRMPSYLQAQRSPVQNL